MSEAPADFGTGLRAHLHLDESASTTLDLGFVDTLQAPEPVAELVQAPDIAVADALAARETELAVREHALALREANLAGRVASVLAAAQALYDELPGSAREDDVDELARLRRRKTVA